MFNDAVFSPLFLSINSEAVHKLLHVLTGCHEFCTTILTQSIVITLLWGEKIKIYTKIMQHLRNKKP